MQKAQFDYIIVHGNKAHEDDMVGMMLAAFCTDAKLIIRRKPIKDEINNPRIMIIDTGRHYEPDKGNLDHHQDGSLACAAHLVVKHFFGDEGIKTFSAVFPGFTTMDDIDRTGPFNTAKKLGIAPDRVFELEGIAGAALLDVISQQSTISGPWLELIKECGKAIVTKAERYKTDMETMEKLRISQIRGIRYCNVGSVDNTAMFDYAKKHNIAVMITIDRDDPTKLRLRNMNNHDGVNLKQLAGCNDVVSITNSGHFAVINANASLMPLISMAVITTSRSLEQPSS